MSLNVEAPLQLCQLIVPCMVERGRGRVINVASVYGLPGGDASRYPGIGLDIASYFASKHALIGVTKFLGTQLGAPMSPSNAPCPGMFPRAENDETLKPEVIDALCAGTPMGRLGTDPDLRSAVLASRRARVLVRDRGRAWWSTPLDRLMIGL